MGVAHSGARAELQLRARCRSAAMVAAIRSGIGSAAQRSEPICRARHCFSAGERAPHDFPRDLALSGSQNGVIVCARTVPIPPYLPDPLLSSRFHRSSMSRSSPTGPSRTRCPSTYARRHFFDIKSLERAEATQVCVRMLEGSMPHPPALGQPPASAVLAAFLASRRPTRRSPAAVAASRSPAALLPRRRVVSRGAARHRRPLRGPLVLSPPRGGSARARARLRRQRRWPRGRSGGSAWRKT